MGQAQRVRQRVEAPIVLPEARRRRRWLRYALGLLAGVALLGGLALLPARAARSELEGGRDALSRAVAFLLEGEPGAARLAFDEAGAAFGRAGAQAGSPFLRLPGLVPILGRTPDALRTLAEIGEAISGAGAMATEALAELPGGLAGLAPRDGRIPIEALEAIGPAVHRAAVRLAEAAALASRLPDSWVPGSVGGAGALVRDVLDQALRLAREADALMAVLPAFAGRDGVRRYFVGAQNPAELRGTGGFIGVYAVLTLDGGHLELGPFRDIQTLPDLPSSAVPAPTPEFAEIYGRYGGAGFWENINMTPDAPTAASLIESLYERVEGVRLDGTILVDPHALAAILEATGPVRVPALDRTLAAHDVVPFVTNRAYFLYDSDVRRRVLGLSAHAVLRRFLTAAPPEAALRSLVVAASGGHLVLHAADPEVQAGFERAGVAGEVGTPGGDFLGVFASNAAGNKVDYYVDRALRYEISLSPGGTGTARATLDLANRAPQGPPGEILGPYLGTGLGAGDDLSFVSVFCAEGCRITGVTEGGEGRGTEFHEEFGYPMLATFLRVDAGASRSLRASFELPHAWEGDGLDGTYRLRLQGQPGIRPMDVTVEIRAPEGMLITHTSPGMEVSGDRAVWRGTLGDVVDLTVEFEKPFPARLWSRLWTFLSRPVIRL